MSPRDDADMTLAPVISQWWAYGFSLTCGHWVNLGNAPSWNAAQDALTAYPVRYDGWYAAPQCAECGRRRRVVHAYVCEYGEWLRRHPGAA